MHRAKVPGPLAPFADGFRAELDRLGYTPASREYKVNQMASLSRWLESRSLGASEMNTERVGAFLAVLGTSRRQPPRLRAMRPLLEWLRAEGVITADPPGVVAPLDALIADYRRWMATERDLAERTIERYERTARRFLGERADPGGGTGIDGLSGEAVTAFLLAEVARGLRLGSLQGRVAELRSLLRFLYLAGLTDVALAQSVPPVPGWKQTRVPPRMAAGDVAALLASCGQTTTTGNATWPC